MSALPPLLNQPPLQKKRGCFPIVVLMVVLFVAGIVVLIVLGDIIQSAGTSSSSPSPHNQESSAELIDKVLTMSQQGHQNNIHSIVMKKFLWHKGGLGHIAIVNFTLENTSNLCMKDVVLEIHWQGESGTEIGRSRQTFYKIVPPYKTIQTGDINAGLINEQTTSASASVVDLVEDLSYSPPPETKAQHIPTTHN